MKILLNLVKLLPSHCFRARPGQSRDRLNWWWLAAGVGVAGMALALLHIGGCGAMIPGAERTVTFYDPTSGKPTAIWGYTGDDMKAAGIVFQNGTGHYWRARDLNDTDVVSQYQAQAFLAGVALANNIAAAAAGRLGTSAGTTPIPTYVPAPAPIPTSAPAAPKPARAAPKPPAGSEVTPIVPPASQPAAKPSS